MFRGLSVLVSFSYFGVDVSLVDGMMFVTIKAAVGIYRIYQNPGMWPKVKTEMHTSGQRVFRHLEVKSRCWKRGLGQGGRTCLV